MATSTIDAYGPDPRIKIPSRLIPGGQALGRRSRRKSASATMDGRFWSQHEDEERAFCKPALWQRMLAALLPRTAARNVLIVGAGRLGRNLASKLQQNCSCGHAICGFLDEREPLGNDVLGRAADFAQIARRHFVDEVILTIPPETVAGQKIVREARSNRIDLRVVPQILGFSSDAVSLKNLGGIPVLTFSEEPIPTLGLTLKRTLDMAFSLLALLLAGPLLCTIALAIKLDTPGPVLYLAPRLGRKGRRFVCFKFRSMAADADRCKAKLRCHNEREGAFFKIADDPRITRIGKILRRYSLDELPQLFNVLRGEMSLVGPRPHPVDDFERYQLEDLQRLEVTPGLTGLWQVTARRDPSFERGMMLDREYIGRWNLWLDFRILCKTVLVVLRGEGV